MLAIAGDFQKHSMRNYHAETAHFLSSQVLFIQVLESKEVFLQLE